MLDCRIYRIAIIGYMFCDGIELAMYDTVDVLLC